MKYEIKYPIRYTEYVFEKYNEMIKDVKLQQDYDKWKNGINYNTNRKIKIGGKVHTTLGDKFYIHYRHSLCSHGMNTRKCCIMFKDLSDINQADYLYGTKTIYESIDIQNKVIDEYNKQYFKKRRYDHGAYDDSDKYRSESKIGHWW